MDIQEKDEVVWHTIARKERYLEISTVNGYFLIYIYIYICQENARRLVAFEYCEDTLR